MLLFIDSHLLYCLYVSMGAALAEKKEVREKTVASWCVEEQAMEVDIRLLQQVEALERRVDPAGLQIKVKES